MLRKLLSGVPKEMRYEIWGILLVAIAGIALCALAGLNVGSLGQALKKVQTYLFGLGAFVPPLLVAVIGARYIWLRVEAGFTLRFVGFIASYWLLLMLVHHLLIQPGREILPESLTEGGGLLGGMALFLLRKFVGVDGAVILIIAVLLCTIMVTTTWSLGKTMHVAKDKVDTGLQEAREKVAATYEKAQQRVALYNQERDARFASEHAVLTDPAEKSAEKPSVPAFQEERNEEKPVRTTVRVRKEPEPFVSGAEATPLELFTPREVSPHGYQLPPLDLIRKPRAATSANSQKEMKENAKILEETMADFNVAARIVEITQGPAVTRYEIEPAPGVKVSKIVSLADDIALKLAATGVRIEAPIPGKAAVGIEVPNRQVTGVAFCEVVESTSFQKAASLLTVGLGKDIAGQIILADLGKMPHLLVAGATGSGKSVCINTMIASLLFRVRPEEVKLILVDPKFVELSKYNGIPHLLVPVVTDAKKATAALNWAVQEMERRYAVLATARVRDLASYNAGVEEDKRLPYIVIIIDELADLMMASPVDVEDAICRLAQKARAAGLHLILATQRPSVDVITGTIKANIPSRISFSVSSQIDSRTILDMPGAEKLLGRGDMLLYPVGMAKPQRVQGAFLGDDDIEKVLDFVRSQQEEEPEYNEEVTASAETSGGMSADLQHDELLPEAVRLVLETGTASASMLQRKLRVGHSRAGRLMDMMEEMRIVGPNMGSRPRDILMTYEQAKEMLSGDTA
ncbi:MAG: DNA translocase FtsK 4TM domain-containing protein [Anaeromusa sp.]|uniref:FtsK/SpoIIIE family DNA translocase n=1 Tax=Anaeromusa sp. TaxID=1872520 RepID=UPI002623F965|nr:DNA translocase FtsK [Anaeromusa sp.]MDD3158591.1 DNA translocase FtsK 4TM domain-containing protein [Anaeromusa sp.]MEA4833862.1 DNA translocase FtsK 4TM domain-containing protein [Anaeromusa sp.]